MTTPSVPSDRPRDPGLSAARPLAFFSWIIGLATVLAVLYPFSTTAPLTAKLATAVVDLVLGVAIGSLLNGVAARSMRRTTLQSGHRPDQLYDPARSGTEI
jgi:hypothetical protein